MRKVNVNIKTRNPIAKALINPLFRKKVVTNKIKYTRKVKHKNNPAD